MAGNIFSTILFVSLFSFPRLASPQITVSQSTTVIIYQTIYPTVTVYLSNTSCPILQWCNQATWATNTSSSASPISFSFENDLQDSQASTYSNANISTYYFGFSTTSQLVEVMGNVDLNTDTSQSVSLESIPSSSISSISTTSSSTSTTIFSTVSSIPKPTTSSSISSSLRVPNRLQSATKTTTSSHITPLLLRPHTHSPFLLQRQGLGDFVQYGPEGSIILGPAIPDALQDRSTPASFILHQHGYLTCGHDINDVVFLRQAKFTDANSYSESVNMSYYKVIHGPKSDVFSYDLTSEFILTDGLLGFTREGFDGDAFGWYIDGGDASAVRLYMASTEFPLPDSFSQVQLSKKKASNIPTNDQEEDFLATTNSQLITFDTEIFESPTEDLESTPTETEISEILDEVVSDSEPVETSEPTGTCDGRPNPTLVLDLVNWIYDFKLQGYCSSLLGYDTETTSTAEEKIKFTRAKTVTRTVEITETETLTTFTETITIESTTIYDANNGPQVKRRQDEVKILVTEEEAPITTAIDTPAQIMPFCPADIRAACSNALAFSSTFFPNEQTKPTKKPTITVFTTITNTETEIAEEATTTTLADVTEISYDGTGFLMPDSGAYRLWYLYWTGELADPALYLRLVASNATFTAEYRQSLGVYRVYTKYADGTLYYMSIRIPVGMSSIADYTVGLETLNDINSDENVVLLYFNFDWNSGYIWVNSSVTGTEKNTMFGCPMSFGKQLRSQVRLYAVGDESVPSDCMGWSNLMFAS
ncbi:hypothetical protein TWF694_000408 [Orbilia ellipsospora]|uniref:GLEYA adhesin domain-containing protein n=1 Tax=Orbilia ellipsospora TaxID=2528407 RepID=A0AAV9XNH0_9PEZI